MNLGVAPVGIPAEHTRSGGAAFKAAAKKVAAAATRNAAPPSLPAQPRDFGLDALFAAAMTPRTQRGYVPNTGYDLSETPLLTPPSHYVYMESRDGNPGYYDPGPGMGDAVANRPSPPPPSGKLTPLIPLGQHGQTPNTPQTGPTGVETWFSKELALYTPNALPAPTPSTPFSPNRLPAGGSNFYTPPALPIPPPRPPAPPIHLPYTGVVTIPNQPEPMRDTDLVGHLPLSYSTAVGAPIFQALPAPGLALPPGGPPDDDDDDDDDDPNPDRNRGGVGGERRGGNNNNGGDFGGGGDPGGGGSLLKFGFGALAALFGLFFPRRFFKAVTELDPVKAVKGLYNDLTEGLKKAYNAIKDLIMAALNAMMNGAQSLLSRLLAALQALLARLGQWGQYLLWLVFAYLALKFLR